MTALPREIVKADFRLEEIMNRAGLLVKTVRWILLATLLFQPCCVPCPQSFTGRIAVVGNEPFTTVALIVDDNSYELAGPLAEELRARQGETVRIIARRFEEAGRVAAEGELQCLSVHLPALGVSPGIVEIQGGAICSENCLSVC